MSLGDLQAQVSFADLADYFGPKVSMREPHLLCWGANGHVPRASPTGPRRIRSDIGTSQAGEADR